MAVALQRLEAAAGSQIPEANGAVIAPAGKDFPTGTKGDGSYAIRKPFECLEALGSLGILQSHSMVLAASGKDASIRAEGD